MLLQCNQFDRAVHPMLALWFTCRTMVDDLPSIEYLCKKAAMIPTIAADLNHSGKISRDCAIPASCLRAASTLRIIPETTGQNPLRRRMPPWQEGWAETQWSRRALRLFLEGEHGNNEISKKIQVQVRDQMVITRQMPIPWTIVDSQLTFLCFLTENIIKGSCLSSLIDDIEIITIKGMVLAGKPTKVLPPIAKPPLFVNGPEDLSAIHDILQTAFEGSSEPKRTNYYRIFLQYSSVEGWRARCERKWGGDCSDVADQERILRHDGLDTLTRRGYQL